MKVVYLVKKRVSRFTDMESVGVYRTVTSAISAVADILKANSEVRVIGGNSSECEKYSSFEEYCYHAAVAGDWCHIARFESVAYYDN